MDFNSGFNASHVSLTTAGSHGHWLRADDVRFYGSGRAAFVDLVQHLVQKRGVKKLLMPSWQCFELLVSLKQAVAVEIEFYSVTKEFLPDAADVRFARALDRSDTAIIVVDYFASVDGAKLETMLGDHKCYVLYDCVHSWPVAKPRLGSLAERKVVIAGFRKVFWKLFGGIVVGPVARELSLAPALISAAAPGFPRNLSLTPRWGWLGQVMGRFLNLRLLDAKALSWGARKETAPSVVSTFRSPVKLGDKSAATVLGKWPDLWEGLSAIDRAEAQRMRDDHPVVRRSSR